MSTKTPAEVFDWNCIKSIHPFGIHQPVNAVSVSVSLGLSLFIFPVFFLELSAYRSYICFERFSLESIVKV